MQLASCLALASPLAVLANVALCHALLCRPVMQLANGVRDQSGPSAQAAAAELAAAAKRAKARPQVCRQRVGSRLCVVCLHVGIHSGGSAVVAAKARRRHRWVAWCPGQLVSCGDSSQKGRVAHGCDAHLCRTPGTVLTHPHHTCGNNRWYVWSASPPLQPDAYEFSIRTPVTPARWRDYDEVGSARASKR